MVSALLLIPVFSPGRGHCASQTPEQFVRDFYKWYFEADQKAPADQNDEIFKYLSAKTVAYIRSDAWNCDEYYVTRANTWTAAWNNVKTVVAKAIPMASDIFVVPVTFHTKWGKYHVVVFVAKENGQLRITKITDIYPYS